MLILLPLAPFSTYFICYILYLCLFSNFHMYHLLSGDNHFFINGNSFHPVLSNLELCFCCVNVTSKTGVNNYHVNVLKYSIVQRSILPQIYQWNPSLPHKSSVHWRWQPKWEGFSRLGLPNMWVLFLGGIYASAALDLLFPEGQLDKYVMIWFWSSKVCSWHQFLILCPCQHVAHTLFKGYCSCKQRVPRPKAWWL